MTFPGFHSVVIKARYDFDSYSLRVKERSGPIASIAAFLSAFTKRDASHMPFDLGNSLCALLSFVHYFL